MRSTTRRCFSFTGLIAFVTLASVFAACRSKQPEAPPVATPSVALARSRVELGSPLDITYTFVVADNAKFQLLPQTENVPVVYKEGWHPVEVGEHSSCASVEWQWTKKDATLIFRNPKKDSVLYLDTDNPGSVFTQNQEVQVSLAGQPLDHFTVTPKQQLLQKIPMTVAQLGTADMVELQIDVDKTFVPALLPGSNSKDPRELGIRVFHAFVQPTP